MEEITHHYVSTTPFAKQMRNRFRDYAKYVISDRALPDGRDGLKPVHRRILWAMSKKNLDLGPRSAHKKCARIVGETTGRFHPHAGGVYETLVRLAQDWSLRYPLVDPQGNFGSIDGFPPAAMRYTEARLTELSYQMMEDIDEDVVRFVDNFDNSETEPTVLPVNAPNLLLNGSYGIAVGISSNIPPHNLTELMQASLALLDDMDLTIEELMDYVTAPDFPTGGKLVGLKGVYSLFKSGRGSLRLRSTTHLETPENDDVDEPMIVVTEIPYLQNKSKIIEGIAKLIDNNKIRGVKDVRDLSKKTIRIEIVIENQYANEDSVTTILGQLFKKTNLETLFHARVNAIVYGKPKTLNLKQSLCVFLDFREHTLREIFRLELESVMARLHILEGLIKASVHIDEIIELIQKSDSRSHAKDRLMNKYQLTDKQADAILNMRLGSLARVEQLELQKEADGKEERRDELLKLIEHRPTILDYMKDEFENTIKRFGDDRRTEIIEKDTIIQTTERPILHPRTLLITSTEEQYVRAIEYNKFRTQRRSGRGVAGVPLEDDKLHDMIVVSNLDDLLLITKSGIVHQIGAYELPEVRSRTAKGSKINRYLPVEDPVIKVVSVEHEGYAEDKYLVTATKNGIIKKTSLSSYSNIRRTGIICVNLKEGDEVVDAYVTQGDSLIIMASKKGQAAVFDEEQVRVQGRNTQGVIGMKLRKGDEVVSSFAVPKSETDETSILTVTQNGYGKRTPLKRYRVTNRNVKGVRNLKVVKKNGPVVYSMPVPIEAGDSQLSLVNSDGILIKVRISGIRNMGRSTQGVKVMRIQGDQELVMASTVIDEGEEEEIQEDEEDLAEIESDVDEDDEDIDNNSD